MLRISSERMNSPIKILMVFLCLYELHVWALASRLDGLSIGISKQSENNQSKGSFPQQSWEIFLTNRMYHKLCKTTWSYMLVMHLLLPMMVAILLPNVAKNSIGIFFLSSSRIGHLIRNVAFLCITLIILIKMLPAVLSDIPNIFPRNAFGRFVLSLMSVSIIICHV